MGRQKAPREKLLDFVADHPGCSTVRLIRCFGVDMTNTLKKLQREGLIRGDWWTPPGHRPVRLWYRIERGTE
jgi:hypothetical protein